MTGSKWIKSDGTAQKLSELDTCHLFYTLRLVWNSMMPRPLSIGTFKSVLFRPDLYTSEYWSKCLPVMFDELHSRTDLPERYKKQLANIQLEALLDRTSEASLDNAIMDFLNREDTEYLPEAKVDTWDEQPGKDLSHSHHTLIKSYAGSVCPRCKSRFPGKDYWDKVGVTCPICTSQFDYVQS